MSDQSSFRKFDYTLRPAKNIERKMMAELFGRVMTLQPNCQHAYIGFGSVYFTDFALFHRNLGFTPMYSIEGDLEGQRRAAFNAPFSCVTVLAGRSEQHLPTVPITQPSVVWLDYDTELYAGAISDVATVISRQCNAGFSGAFVAISIDVTSKRLERPKSIGESELEEWPDDPVEQFRRLVGESNFPAETTNVDLRGANVAETYRKVINARIGSTLAAVDGWRYQQLLNFRYADGAEMGTFGGVLYRAEDEEKIASAGFESFAFVRKDADPCYIRTPLLTFREIHSLGREVAMEEPPPHIPVDPSQFEIFKEVYRYFPAFIEAEL